MNRLGFAIVILPPPTCINCKERIMFPKWKRKAEYLPPMEAMGQSKKHACCNSWPLQPNKGEHIQQQKRVLMRTDRTAGDTASRPFWL